MIFLKDQKGQSAAEFVLVAPFLFLFFFCVLQMAYMGFVSFAVQRAALAIARKASLGSTENSTAFKSQLALSLLPIASLNQKTLLTILETNYQITQSTDQKQVSAKVRYPMPIWIPLVRNIFGETLTPSANYNDSPEGKAIKMVFSLLKKPEPDLSFHGLSLPVRWIVFEETTFNESYQSK